MNLEVVVFVKHMFQCVIVPKDTPQGVLFFLSNKPMHQFASPYTQILCILHTDGGKLPICAMKSATSATTLMET